MAKEVTSKSKFQEVTTENYGSSPMDGWDWRHGVAEKAPPDFMKTINSAIEDAGEKGIYKIEIDLPPRYRGKTAMGLRLRRQIWVDLSERDIQCDFCREDDSCVWDATEEMDYEGKSITKIQLAPKPKPRSYY